MTGMNQISDWEEVPQFDGEAAEATYSAGRNTLRDVLEAQAALKEARQALVQAQVNELKARLDLELLRGSLADTLELELQ